MSQSDCANLKSLYENYLAAVERFRLMKMGRDEKKALLAQMKEVVASRKKLFDAMQETIPLFSLKKLHDEFGYNDDVFYTMIEDPDGRDPREFRFDAAIYQTIIWELASEFNDHQQALSGSRFKWLQNEEMDKPVELFFGLTLLGKEFAQFKDFLEKHLTFIPNEFLHRFKLVIGIDFYFGGGLEISNGKISVISQEEVNLAYTNKKLVAIGSPKIPVANDKYNIIDLRLARKIRERFHHT